MGIYPAPLEALVDRLAALPGLGPKSAMRIALHILRSDESTIRELSQALLEVKEKIMFCSVCFNIADSDPCNICADPDRASHLICVVETPGEQLAIEEAGAFKGKYHVLHGALSPLDGIGPEALKIGELIVRIKKEQIKEVILATNPTTQGEATASFIARVLMEKYPDLNLYRIALGVPMGADLKYMDRLTLEHAFRSKTPLKI